jgi:hypothetical protein
MSNVSQILMPGEKFHVVYSQDAPGLITDVLVFATGRDHTKRSGVRAMMQVIWMAWPT